MGGGGARVADNDLPFCGRNFRADASKVMNPASGDPIYSVSSIRKMLAGNRPLHSNRHLEDDAERGSLSPNTKQNSFLSRATLEYSNICLNPDHNCRSRLPNRGKTWGLYGRTLDSITLTAGHFRFRFRPLLHF